MSSVCTPRPSVLLAALGLSLAGAVGSAHALDFGHARMLSGVGQPLRADMAIVQLTPQELADVQVRLAPAAAWAEAGLTPPVDLASLRVQMLPGLAPDARTLRITSDQVFDGDVADLLIDVSTPAGALRHQVSLVPQRRTIRLAAGAEAIAVRRGDTLWALAEQHAAPGFSVYQMMAALLAENADAFIDGNMNLVKAGAALRRPDRATLARLTDRQARQLFVAHAQALAARRGGTGAALVAVPGAAASSPVVAAQAPSADGAPTPTQESAQDQLRLRGVDADVPGAGASLAASDPDAQTAARRAVQDSLARIAQLEQNVQDLNQVLRDLETSGAAPTGPLAAGGSAADAPAARAAGQGNDARTNRDAVQDALRRIEALQQSAQALDQSLRAESSTVESASGAVVGAVEPERAAGSAQVDAARPSVPPTAPAGASADVQQALRRIEQVQESAQALDQSLRAQADVLAAQAQSGSVPAAAPPAPSIPASSSQAPSSPAQVAPAAQDTQGAGTSLWPWLVAALVLLAVMVAGLRRRTRAANAGAGTITDAMIEDKLKTINLDLDEDDATSKPDAAARSS